MSGEHFGSLDLTSEFQAAATFRPATYKRKRREPPFSIRLSKAEKDWLRKKANGQPISSYIRARLLEEYRPARPSSSDRQLLATVLAQLGRSRLASNVNQIAAHFNAGTIEVTPDLMADFNEAVQAIKDMRRTLMVALGLKSEGRATNAGVAGKAT